MINQYHRAFLEELNIRNAQTGLLISGLGSIFFVLLLILDWLRYREGMFDGSGYYEIMMALHLTLGLTIIPTLLFWKNRGAIKAGDYLYTNRIIYTSIFILGLALIPMTWLSILDRESILPFGVFIIILNLLFYIPRKPRFYINIVALAICLLGMQGMEIKSAGFYIYVIEASALVIPTLLISNVQYDLIKSNFYNKKRLEAKNKSIQLVNAQLQMQALQSQMNPHFIFNTLNSIQHFIVSNDQTSSLTYMGRFSKLIRMIFQYSKQRLISLEDELAFLELYLQLEELRFESKVDISFEVAAALSESKEELFLPPLLIQPVIENAFKHGLMHRETGGELSIQLSLLEENLLRCVVEDNGVGRNQARNFSTLPGQSQGEGQGLEIIRKRLAIYHELNTRHKISQQLRIIDLEGEQDEPKGTRIEMIVTLQSSSTSAIIQSSQNKSIET